MREGLKRRKDPLRFKGEVVDKKLPVSMPPQQGDNRPLHTGCSDFDLLPSQQIGDRETDLKRHHLATTSSPAIQGTLPPKPEDSLDNQDVPTQSRSHPRAVASRYLNIIRTNRGYRLYLMSHICQHAGDWFVHVAALLVVERLAPGSASALSALVLTKTLPLLLLSPIGGALADAFDRRRLMIALDLVSAVTVLGYLFALAFDKVAILYITATLRSSVLSIYEPVTKSIVPLIVTDAGDLKKAVTMNGVAWSVMIMFGGVVAGYASSYIGVEACFVIDSVTYFISAYIISLLEGEFSVAKERCSNTGLAKTSRELHVTCWSILYRAFWPLGSFIIMTGDLISYLWICGFGILAFMKSSGSVTWGAADVLNVSFAKVEGDEAATGQRLGLIYSCIGVGCLIGPIVSNTYTDPRRPSTLQLASICALAVMAFGWMGISFVNDFRLICVFTTIRTLGSSTIWMNSTLLLQQLSRKDILGRVLAFEFGCAMGLESLSAYLTGRFKDAGYGEAQIAKAAATVGGTLFTVWSVYHIIGGGAAQRQFNMKQEDETIRADGETHESVMV